MTTFADFGIAIPLGSRGEIDVMCPKCGGINRTKRANQKKRTLSVNVEKGVWECHHCEWKGGLKQSNPFATQSREYNGPAPIVSVFNAQERMYQWFEQRGISREVVDRNRVTTHQTDKGVAIAFPHYRNGEHVHTAFRALSAKKVMWQDSGTERIFWGLDDIKPTDRSVVICEGHPDKLAWDQALVNSVPVLSIPDGAGLGDSKLSYLSSAANIFQRMNRVYLALDDDEPGQELMHELARRIGIDKCFITTYIDGCKDANDVLLLDFGADKLRQLHDASRPYPVDGIFTASSVRDDMEQYIAFGPDTGVTSGFDGLDKLFRPRQGMVTLISGISGHGKSEFMDQLALAYAKRHRWPFAIFSPENLPMHEHLIEMAETLLQKSYKQMQVDELDLVMPFLDEHFIFIYPEKYAIDAILDRMRVAVLRNGVKACIIDPYNMIEHARPKDMSETEYVSEVMTKLSKFAQANGVAVFLIAHPAKFDNYSKREEEPKPTLNEIAGSGNFRNKCDAGLIIWRDIYNETMPAQCMVQKIRHKATGKTGIWYFRLDHQTRQMVETSAPLTPLVNGVRSA